MSVVNEDSLDCAMVSSGVTVVVASVQEHSARVVPHRLHPNSMSLPIASPHLLLHKLLTSSDHAMAAFQILASVEFLAICTALSNAVFVSAIILSSS